MTTIIKRQNGVVVSAILAGNHAAVPVAVPKALLAAPTAEQKAAPKKAKRTKKQTTNIEAHVAEGASTGQALAVALFTASQIVDVEERTKKCFSLGKKAKQIGTADPDVQAALQAAQKNQIESIPATESEFLDTQAIIFDSWGAAFMGGFMAKVATKGEATPKGYLLKVSIPEYKNGIDKVEAVEKTQKFEKFGDAERAANRWWVVKSEQSDHARMSVVIETLDLEASEAAGEDVCIPGLTYVVTREAAAAKMETQRRREKAEAALASKGKPQSVSLNRYDVGKCKETRVTFSRG